MFATRTLLRVCHRILSADLDLVIYIDQKNGDNKKDRHPAPTPVMDTSG